MKYSRKKKREKKKKKHKEVFKYGKKFRASPIFEAPSTIYTRKLDVSLETNKQKPLKRKTNNKEVSNLIGTQIKSKQERKQIRKKAKKTKEKQFWSV